MHIQPIGGSTIYAWILGMTSLKLLKCSKQYDLIVLYSNLKYLTHVSQVHGNLGNPLKLDVSMPETVRVLSSIT